MACRLKEAKSKEKNCHRSDVGEKSTQRDPRGGRRWKENTKVIFKRLSPHFSCYDDYKIGRDFVI